MSSLLLLFAIASAIIIIQHQGSLLLFSLAVWDSDSGLLVHLIALTKNQNGSLEVSIVVAIQK